jgi:hypothetical protein
MDKLNTDKKYKLSQKKIKKLTSILEKHQIDDNIKTLIINDYVKELSS